MEKSALSKQELNKLPKDAVVLLCMQLSENFRLLSDQNTLIRKQNEQLIKQVEDLKEQISILTQHRFGRKSEASKQIPGQLSLDL